LMRVSEYAVILVHSTSHAVQAERVLKRGAVEVKLIPTPREISSDCGSALRIRRQDRARCEELLAAAGVPIDRVEDV